MKAKFVNESNIFKSKTNDEILLEIKKMPPISAFFEAIKYGLIDYIKLKLKENKHIKNHEWGDGMPNTYIPVSSGLKCACEVGNVEITKLLIKNGADIHTEQGAPLILAIINNNIEIVKLLLTKGINANITNISNGLPLKYAVEKENINIIKLLLDAGANVNIQNNYPLRLSISKNNYEIVKLLLEAGADPGKFTKDNELLKRVLLNNNYSIARLLKIYEK